jgi:hypothetical protein
MDEKFKDTEILEKKKKPKMLKMKNSINQKTRQKISPTD